MARQARLNDIPCPECKEPVASDATRCPHCQAIYSPEVIADRQALQKKKRQESFFGCGAILLIMAVGLAYCVPKDGDNVVEGSGDPKADAIQLYNNVLAAASECDQRSARLVEDLQGGDPVAAYRTAEQAASVCLYTDNEIQEIGIPNSFDDEDEADAQEALQTCGDAYVAKWSWADGVKDSIDQGPTISQLAQLEDATTAAQNYSMLCMTGLMSIAIKHGATEADLGIETPDDS